MLKKELDFEIKMEPDEESDNSRFYSTEYIHMERVEPERPHCAKCIEMQAEINTLKDDREKLFADILNAKSESHQLLNEKNGIKRAADKNDEIYKKEVNLLKQKLEAKSAEIKELTVNKKLQSIDKNATISDLRKRNAAICTKMSNMNIDSEVEGILGHAKRKGREMFLIQWKNSWIPEENLNCPVKLQKYRRQI